MGSFEAWIVFIGSFLVSAAALSMSVLSRQDFDVLRRFSASPKDEEPDFTEFEEEIDEAINVATERPSAAVIPLHGDLIQSPDDVEESIAVLIDGPGGSLPAATKRQGFRQVPPAPPRDGSFSGVTALNTEAAFYEMHADYDPLREPDDEEEPETPEQAAGRRKATLSLMTFLEKALLAFTEQGFRLGAGDRFGSNLFVTGACEAMYHIHGLAQGPFMDMLAAALRAIGNESETARRLAQRYDEYLLEPQYIGIFQAGSDAITRFVVGDEEAVQAFVAAIKEWRNPQSRAHYDGPVTVLFTDIVGSTQLTQELGDEGAQVIVRAHNSIVRKCLNAHGGAEIKHTGDGIMATFTKSASAVESALAMIEGLELHNEAMPQFPLHIRIGINAGEPILEDNDFFGTTVQMAARICDAAEPDQVLVSMVVRELCGGKTLRFEEAGQYAMKGIEEPVTLHLPSPPLPGEEPAAPEILVAPETPTASEAPEMSAAPEFPAAPAFLMAPPITKT